MRLKQFLLILLTITACEEKAPLPRDTTDTGLLVVEGVLTNENKNHLIKITRPHQEINATPQPVSGATLWVTDQVEIYSLTESPIGSGMYYTPVMRAVSGRTYSLNIEFDGKPYSASDSAVPVQPLRGLKYRENESGYQLTPEPEGEDPNYVEHLISWENTPSCDGEASCSARVIFYDLKTIDVNELFKPEKGAFYFPEQSLVVRRKYSTSDQYRAFLRSMLSETEWRGGVFDIQRDNVPTNLSEGAIGFFAVCSVVSDSTIVQ